MKLSSIMNKPGTAQLGVSLRIQKNLNAFFSNMLKDTIVEITSKFQDKKMHFEKPPNAKNCKWGTLVAKYQKKKGNRLDTVKSFRKKSLTKRKKLTAGRFSLVPLSNIVDIA